MKRNYIYGLSVLLLLAACDNDENLNKLGPISAGEFPTATLSDVPSSSTMVEEDMTIEIPVTLDKAWDYDSEIFIEQTGGDATAGEDFEVHSVRIENGATSGVIVIDIHGDDVPEETETATFKITAGSNLKLSGAEPEFTFTLENYVSPDLHVNVSWAPDFYDESATSLVDFDVYISNEDGDDVAAAESGAFESLDLEGTEPDGEYLLYAFLYADFNPGDFGPVSIPVTSVFSRSGAFSGMTVTQTDDQVITTDAPDYANDEEVTIVPLAYILKEDGVYTIMTYAENAEDRIVIGSGRVKADLFERNKQVLMERHRKGR